MRGIKYSRYAQAHTWLTSKKTDMSLVFEDYFFRMTGRVRTRYTSKKLKDLATSPCAMWLNLQQLRPAHKNKVFREKRNRFVNYGIKVNSTADVNY